MSVCVYVRGGVMSVFVSARKTTDCGTESKLNLCTRVVLTIS